MAQDKRPAPATGIGSVNGHEGRPRRYHGQRHGQRHDRRSQPITLVDLTCEDIEADQKQTAANHGRQPHRQHRAIADQRTASVNQIGHQWPLAVVTPVKVPGPVPVMGFIRSQIKRTVDRQIRYPQSNHHQDKQSGHSTPAPSACLRRHGSVIDPHRSILVCVQSGLQWRCL